VGGGKPAEPGTAALIRRLEEELLLPEVRKSAARVAALLAEEFVEIGSSGRIYDKQQIIDRLQQEQWTGPLPTISDFAARQLALDLVLAIYRIVECNTIRSSIWKTTSIGVANGVPSGHPVRCRASLNRCTETANRCFEHRMTSTVMLAGPIAERRDITIV